MTESIALELWIEWWNYSNGDPWVGDTTDYGSPDSCFFCGSYRDKEHDSDCIYLRCANLLGNEAVA